MPRPGLATHRPLPLCPLPPHLPCPTFPPPATAAPLTRPASARRTSLPASPQLGPYQYKTRVARLRLKGAQVHEFGDRVLQQGSFGDDVMQLQVRRRR